MWIDRQQQEPPTDKRILVWGVDGWPEGVIACELDDYQGWCDVVDNIPVAFRHWMLAPGAPEVQLASNRTFVHGTEMVDGVLFVAMIELDECGKLRRKSLIRGDLCRG